MKKGLFSFIIFLILCSLLLTFVLADGVEPRLNNTLTTSTNFTISSTGKATIAASYNGYQNVTTGATITSYLEKRTLGIFWSKVDIGTTNNMWIDTSSDYLDTFIHTFQLEDTGTYRATVTYEIRGTGGSADVIDYDKTVTYS